MTIPEESLRVVHSTKQGMAHLHGSLRGRVTCSHHLGMKFMQWYVDRKRLCRDEPHSTPSGLAALQPIILHMRQYTIRPLRIGAADDFGSGGVWQHSRGFWGDREWWWWVHTRADGRRECAQRLCVERGRTTCTWGECVLVMVTVTERALPTK